MMPAKQQPQPQLGTSPDKVNYGRWMFFLLGLAVVLFLSDLLLGSVQIPLSEGINILIGNKSSNQVWKIIIDEIRLPKAITAVLAGAALSVSGLQMQTLFRNPLAGPSMLGITSGASLGVALLMLGAGSAASGQAIRSLGVSHSWLLILASCIGSGGVLVIILALSFRVRDNVIILIIGLLLSNLIIAIISIWQYFSEPEQITSYLLWTFGSLSGVANHQLTVLLVVIVSGIFLSILSVKYLNLLLLGENYARSLGLNITRTKFLVILSTSLLVGAVTGFCGPIGFIGMAIPHLARAIFDTSDHRILLPGSALLGAAGMLFCDVIAQLPGYHTVLPINAVTAAIGAPVIIWVILKNRQLRLGYD